MPQETVVLINNSRQPLPWDLADLTAALQAYANLIGYHYGRNIKVVAGPGPEVSADAYPLFLADEADQENALAYHTTDLDGPWGTAFRQDAAKLGVDWSIPIAHELAEMVLNPWCRVQYPGPDLALYAGEIVDPVQGTWFSVKDGIKVPNFVLPAWFGLSNYYYCGETAYDYLCLCRRPFEVLPGGYISRWRQRVGWEDVTVDERGRTHVQHSLGNASSRLSSIRALD